jgi:bacterioferritin
LTEHARLASGEPGHRARTEVTSDPRVRGYLVRALGYETGAVQQYLAQASLTAIWCLEDESRQFRADGIEELGHVERVLQRLLELGVTPPPVASPAVRLGGSVEEMLVIDRELEVDVVRLYEQAGLYSARVGDRSSEELFADLLRDELEHLAHIDACLDETRSGARQHGSA